MESNQHSIDLNLPWGLSRNEEEPYQNQGNSDPHGICLFHEPT